MERTPWEGILADAVETGSMVMGVYYTQKSLREARLHRSNIVRILARPDSLRYHGKSCGARSRKDCGIPRIDRNCHPLKTRAIATGLRPNAETSQYFLLESSPLPPGSQH